VTTMSTQHPITPSPELKEQGLEAFMRSLEQTILASLSLRHTPSSTHMFYKSAAERNEAAKETIQNYLSDGEWCDDVTNVFAFVVTHRATEVDVVRPVGEIDEDGCDEAGEDWSNTNCDYKCNYALKPFPTPEAPNDVINPPVLATHSTPQPPADGELTVNLRMDLSSECLKRLCDGLAAAVKPNGGYRALTTDDDISGEFIGEQQVGVEWWLPEHGCDSLENTLDSIKGRLLAAVQDWLPIASQPATHWLPLNALPTPTPEALPMMTTKTTSNTSSMFTSLLAVLFIGLKLTGYIAWPWLWVLSPIWIPAALALLGVILVGLFK
jgi:hypothetical protein